MGGSIQNLTTFTLLSNFATAIIVPATFPLIYPAADMTFWPAFLLILSRVAPLLLGPFFSAWLLRLGFNRYYRIKSDKIGQNPINSKTREFELPKRLAPVPFYLWVCSIIVLSSVVTETVVNNWSVYLSSIIYLLIASFLGGYDNHTTHRARTIYRGGRTIL